MSRTHEDPAGPSGPISDRALWQRCGLTDAPADEAERLLDLAGFADGLLDPDEHDRVAALLAADPAAASDVAAALALAGGIGETSAGLARIVARAVALRPDTAPERSSVIPLPRAPRRIIVRGLAQWGSLAAAIAMAAWLGFAMGSDTSLALSRPSQIGSDDSFLPELFDPATGFMRDPGESAQT